MLFTSDGMCYVGYSGNIPDSYHLRISQLMSWCNTNTHNTLWGCQHLCKSMIFRCTGIIQGEFFLLYRSTCFWFPLSELVKWTVKTLLCQGGDTATCWCGVGHIAVDKSIPFSRLSAETRTQSIEMVEWTSIHCAFHSSHRRSACAISEYFGFVIKCMIGNVPEWHCVVYPSLSSADQSVHHRQKTMVTDLCYPAEISSLMDFGTPDCSLGKGTHITRQEGEINKEKKHTKCCHGDGLARQLKDAGSSSRPGGQRAAWRPPAVR